MKDKFEIELANLYVLSRKSNGFGIDIEYIVVKDYCLEFDYDYLEVYKILRNINNRLSN